MQVEFWIRSSRGTDQKTVKELPDDTTHEAMKDELEAWCEQFGAWHSSNNHIRYGFKILQ